MRNKRENRDFVALWFDLSFSSPTWRFDAVVTIRVMFNVSICTENRELEGNEGLLRAESQSEIGMWRKSGKYRFTHLF